MKMHAELGCLAAATLTFLAGCLPSLNPVYKDEQLVTDDTALGVWVQPDSPARWELTKRDAKSYTLVFTDDEGHQARFIAHLARIQGTTFLDLVPEESTRSANGFYELHLVPIHSVYLVRQTRPRLELAAIDASWLQRHLTDNPSAIAHSTVGGGKLITAPTEDLQAFVLAHKDAFTAEFKLKRETKPAK